MRPLAIRVALRTGIGARACNEDRVAVEHRDGHACLVVSDGAGGHGEGARAAQLVVERVLAGFRSRPPVDGEDLSELLLDAHDAVLFGQRQSAAARRTGMHATVVVLVVDMTRRVALWGHVGDSRLYHWREGRLMALTRDDSALQAVLETGLVAAGAMGRIRNSGVLLSALGAGEELAPHIAAPLQLEPRDAFLLCTDGWWGGLDPPRMARWLETAATPELWLDAMMRWTQDRADPRQDNYSAIACWIAEPHEDAP